MARKITSRLKIAGTLIAETPLHVGGYGNSPDTDLPLAQNGKGKWYMPGTSIAGVLRNWCCQNFRHIKIQNDKLLIEDVFGFQDGDQGQASFVLIEDATIENADAVLSEIRDGVGIDRFYGVAADKAKYDRAILPRGTELNFQMTVEIASRRDEEPEKIEQPEKDIYLQRVAKTKAVIGYLLEALTKSNVRFGAAKTRGLGRMKLGNLSIKEQSFVGFEILNTLNGGGHPLKVEDLKNDSLAPNASPRLEISITWKARLPVMVKAGYDGIGVDMLPLTSGVKTGELALCLPGSSIKGVLRSHAERIIRTVLPDCDCTKGKTNFHEQIDAIPLVEELFGARNKSDKEGSNARQGKKCKSNANAKLGLGALTIDDCYATEAMDTKQWRAVEIAVEAKKKVTEQEKVEEVSYAQRELWKRLREVDEWKDDFASKEIEDKLSSDEYKKDSRRFRINHHVAIDRWTGGASEGALYSAIVPTEASWDEMGLTLDFGRIETESQLPVLMLLLLILRDVAENRLPFGFATNRGMGEIEVETMLLKGSGFENELSCLNTSSEDGLVLSEGKFTALDKGLKEKLKTEWETWRNKQ
jgi:CRISPR/Cas system CSM-associated protein Csm3 (group 7 of RAMP superfamily)